MNLLESKKLLKEINKSQVPTSEELRSYWPFIRKVLSFTKIFTGAKADEFIDKIIAWGDNEIKKN